MTPASRRLPSLLAPLLVLGALGGGCSAAPGAAQAETGASLEGSRWTLMTATEGRLAAHALESRITLAFVAGRASGYGGCNTYSGDYRFDGQRLEVGALTRTKRGCADLPGELEREWHAFLAGPLEVLRSDTALTLRGAGGQNLQFGVAPAASGTP